MVDLVNRPGATLPIASLRKHERAPKDSLSLVKASVDINM
jgi:hypothetical protein